MPHKSWLFVIDTENYAGNFERELASYCTGWKNEYVGFVADMEDFEDGSIHPDIVAEIEEKLCTWNDDENICELYPTSGWSNNGVGGHTKLKEGEVPKWPAFMSVGIRFDMEPSNFIVSMMKDRAKIFCESHNLTLTGFKLVTVIETKEVIELDV